MLDGRAGAGSNRLNSMHLVLLVFKSSWRPLKESCMALKLVCRVVNSVQRRARCIQNGVVYVEVDKRLTSSKSDIIDVYREESRSKNGTLRHPYRDCQRPGQQALQFDTPKSW